MAYLWLENSFYVDRLGGGCDSPRLHRALFRSPALYRKKEDSALPMWLNFKDKGDKNGAGNKSLLASQSVRRQLSRQSSNRSSGGRSGKSAIMKKLEEREMAEKPGEWQKNQEYKVIRERRKLLRKQIGANLRTIKRLYILSLLMVILGIAFVFGATMRSLGEGTVLWTYKEKFKIIGVAMIVLGIILLLTTVGLDSVSREKLKTAGVEALKPVIHPDFLEEDPNKFRRQTSKCSSASSYDPACPELDRRRLLWNNKNQDCEDGFLCSSIASASTNITMPATMPRTLSSDHWAKAMEINLEGIPNQSESTHHPYFHDMPNIEVTYCDEKSSKTSRTTSEVGDSVPVSSASCYSSSSSSGIYSKTLSSAESGSMKKTRLNGLHPLDDIWIKSSDSVDTNGKCQTNVVNKS